MFLPWAPADPPLGSRHFLLQPSKQQYVPFGHSSSLLQVCASPIWHRLEIDTMGHFPVAAPWVTTRTYKPCSNNIIKILQRSSKRSRTACKRSPIAKKIWLSIHQRKFGIHVTVRPPARRPSVCPSIRPRQFDFPCKGSTCLDRPEYCLVRLYCEKQMMWWKKYNRLLYPQTD